MPVPPAAFEKVRAQMTRASPMRIASPRPRPIGAQDDSTTTFMMALPNGSRLSCGRLARRRKDAGRSPCPARGTTPRFP